MSVVNETNLDISVIIVNWNTEKLLKNCLESLYKLLPLSLASEIIVVDNGSNDESVSMVKRDFPEVILLDTGENLGFVGGNNAG